MVVLPKPEPAALPLLRFYAAGAPDLEEQDVWQLLQLVLPEVQETLWSAVNDLQQALFHGHTDHATRVRPGLGQMHI